MKASIYLTLSKSGVVKMTKEKPLLVSGQRLVRLSLSVPDSAFLPAPVLDAQLDVPADKLTFPTAGDSVDVEIWSD